ncbi:class I SAM-dependent methyltransferase [Candidatus Woesearchaeota archaeon]|jgi:ubiquinone/menaquinone biosynthesis C-methylase UbiE|nr:class I SAM-dependent methyltransferase [Candidatus Woesearchaeota archaeon]MBT4322200.1 class I SAM-dependent methyltransferase [Candidatus Woesearchaeota archaeon]MBT4631220.1 class I SAM-dependent methyltransferase [Candidatus Woesearchaeota archaeon]
MDRNTETTIQAYDATVLDYHEKTKDLFHSKEAKLFTALVGSGAHILDHGSGPGRDAKLFTEFGYRVTGIDLSQKMNDFASKIAPKADFMNMDIRNLDFEDETFNGVWSVTSLLHLPKSDIPGALSEVYRVLKRGGIFYCVVKQGEGEELRVDPRYEERIEKFFSSFLSSELENFLSDANFRIIRSRMATLDTYSIRPELRIFSAKN